MRWAAGRARLEAMTAVSVVPPPPVLAEGRAEVLLRNHSALHGSLLPLRSGDAWVAVRLVEGGEPLRVPRHRLRALKMEAAEPVPAGMAAQPFRFEFHDTGTLAGECTAAQAGPDGVWLDVLGPDRRRRRWFVDHRDAVFAQIGTQRLLPAAAAPARPADLAALRDLLHPARAAAQNAPRLGEALVRTGLVTAEALQRALAEQKRPGTHRPVGRILVEAGALSETQLRMALADWLGVKVVDPRDLAPEPAALALVPRALAEREGVLPLLLDGDTLVVLLADPWDHALVDQLRFVAQHRVQALMAVPGTLMPAVHRAYAAQATAAPAAASRAPADDGSVHAIAAELSEAPAEGEAAAAEVVSESDNALVRLVHSLIHEAIRRRASDIHVETADAPREVRVRLRVDGELVQLVALPARLRFAIVARIKIMADLDISEHRKPQDGKIDFARFGGPPVELRVVTVPTSRGLEDVVLRLLAGSKPMPLDGIGLAPANLAALKKVSARPYGLILICGPTGSGKTTTLHSVLRELNTEGRKIWTAEDPIEITQEGLRQVQMNPRIGWTFAAAMRTFLRADPDVIMIGEMRDDETARIAIEASLTGHLVLSTLHTNSAPESIARLLELGMDPFNFSDSLLAVLAQRLVRRLCTACRVAVPADEDTLEMLAAQSAGPAATPAERAALRADWAARHGDTEGRVRLWRAQGCERCGGDGYHGRLGIHELLVTDDTLRRHIRHREDAHVLQAAALAAGMRTLRQDGIEKLLEGLTDLAEVVAATNA
jgi:type II secretory ATPase GspE/PulE/Tfp pilus assembly ATPase PilB-like protein